MSCRSYFWDKIVRTCGKSAQLRYLGNPADVDERCGRGPTNESSTELEQTVLSALLSATVAAACFRLTFCSSI